MLNNGIPKLKTELTVKKIGQGIVVCGLFFLSGCAVWKPISFHEPVLKELPEQYRNYYSYPESSGEGTVVSQQKIKHYTVRRVEIPLSLPAELTPKDLEKFRAETEELAKTDQKTANDRKLRYLNRIDLYVPNDLKPGEKRPVILISPILGGNMVVDHFAVYYAGRGYIAALVHRKKLFWEDDDDNINQVENYMRTSVIRLRQAIDWLETQPEVDNRRMGAFGVSYGAILHAVLAAVEPRIRYHVLAMPAGPIPEVIMHCPDPMITKLLKKVHEKYGWSDEKIFEDLKKSILTDPILLAPYIQKQKITYYTAIFDRVVGASRSLKLWKAMGKPSLKLMPFGHYGGVLVFPYLEAQSFSAFKKNLRLRS